MRTRAGPAIALSLAFVFAQAGLADEGGAAENYPAIVGDSVDPWNHGHWPVRVRALERIDWKYAGGEHPGMAVPGTDGRIRLMAGGGHLRSIDVVTGKHEWVASAHGKFWNYSSAVVGADGTAYFGNHSFVQAVDATGERLWRTDLRASWIHRPPALSPDGKTLYLVSDAVGLASLDAATGQINWLRRDFKSPWASLCFDEEGKLILGTGHTVTRVDTDGRFLWQLKNGMRDLMVLGDRLFGAAAEAGEVRCVSLRKRKFLWRTSVPKGITGMALGDDGRLRVASATGDLCSIDMAGRLRWKRKVSDDALGRPVTAAGGDTLVCDAQGVLHLVDRAGEVEQSIDTGAAPYRWRPAVGPDGAVYLSHAADTVRISGAERPAPRRLIATELVVVADDFVVDVWVNGEKVPDASRQMLGEVHGAMTEAVHVDLHAGDWVVFNVVNNRLRWGGASYFGVYAKDCRGRMAFASTSKGNWSACDDVTRAADFIADKDVGADRLARRPVRPWRDAGRLWQTHIGRDFPGEPVWGTTPNTWIKCIVPAPR